MRQPSAPARLYHGAAYYPELWPESLQDEDIAQMLRLGLNVVRMGEFAWAAMEPDEGAIDLSFFARAIDRLHAAGMRVVLCTPTATPPIWLTHGHPERCYVTAEGYVMPHGGRQHACYENEDFRRYAERITEAMAKTFGRHPAVIAWQIDNEFKCHAAEDFNPSTVARWHAWLRRRYGTIDALNAAWGADIWSERYQSFDQIRPPGRTPFQQNSSLATSYRLFSREEIAAFAHSQADIIRRHSAAPVTTNATLWFAISQERMFSGVDFAAWDDYPGHHNWARQVFNCDLYRNAVPGKPFWCMETSASYNGWQNCNPETIHPPGFVAAEAVAVYSLGGEAILYWLWRQQRSGVEQPHSAVLQSWGKPSLGYIEVARAEAARRALEPLLVDSTPEAAQVAVTWSDRGRVMLQVEALGAGNGHEISHDEIVTGWHRQLVHLGFHRDVRFEGASLDGLKLLVTPILPAITPDFLERVRTWVEAGGVWLVGPLAGYRTEEHTVPLNAALGPLEKLAGVETIYSYPANRSGAQGEAFGRSATLVGWTHAVRPVDAQTLVLGTLRTGHHDNGLAFLTERKVGRGRVLLLAGDPSGDAGMKLREQLLLHCADVAGVTRFGVSPGTIIAPRRTSAGARLWIAQNLDGKGGRVRLDAGALDAFDGAPVTDSEAEIAPYGYRVFRFGI